MPPEAPATGVHAELALRAGLGVEGSAAELDRLLAVARVVALEPGQLLCTAGAPLDCVWQLEDGELEIQIGNDTLRVASNGAVGLIDLLQRQAHSHSVRAISPARLLEIPADEYLELLEDSFDLTQRLIARWATELVEMVVASGAADTVFAGDGSSLETGHRFSMNLEIPTVERIILLGHVAAFRSATTQALANLAVAARERRFAASESITQPDTTRSTISVLVRGAVELELEGERVHRACTELLSHVHELTPRTQLGVLAASQVLVLEIDREDLVDCMEEHFDLAASLLGYLASIRGVLNARGAAAGTAEPCAWC